MKKVMFLTLIALMLFLAACDINEPKTPQWDVNFKVPLMNKDYYAGDLIDSLNFGMDADSTMFFYTEGLIEGAEIEEGRLKISANPDGSGFIPIVSSIQLDSISIHNPEMQDDVEIVSSTVRSGQLRFEFTGTDYSKLQSVTIAFEELHSPDGTPYTKTFTSNELSSINDIDLANFRFYQEDPNQILTDIHFTITHELNPGVSVPAGTILTNVKVNYENPIYFSQIRGLIHSLEIDADDFSSNISVEYPDNIENAMHINSPVVKFNIWNKLGYTAFFNGTLVSYNSRTGESRTYPLAQRTIERAYTIGDSTLTTLEFTESVEHIMSIMPDRFELVNATFTLDNPLNLIGFAREGQGYSGNYRATVPFDIQFTANEPIRPKELIEMNISESNRDQIEKNAKNVNFTVKVWNEFNAGASVNMYLCNVNDKNVVYQNTEINTPTLKRVVFLNNSITPGSVTSPSPGILEFSISEDDLSIFTEHETIYFGIQFTFNDSNTIMHSYEKIKVISSLDIVMTINGDQE
ncbi:MAG: hypothetical protein KA886_01225 [Candidatus Cloacimonetes bacterium]|nr:hypothetical protein [Candidatus Cloacimonadota bacterium]